MISHVEIGNYLNFELNIGKILIEFIVTDKNQTKFTFSCPLNKTAEDAISKPPTKFE